MMCNGSVDWSLIVHTITNEAIDNMISWGQQHRHLRRVVLMALRHGRGDHLHLVIGAEVPLLPALALLLAVFLSIPFALATDL
jgi:hypothetical protein